MLLLVEVVDVLLEAAKRDRLLSTVRLFYQLDLIDKRLVFAHQGQLALVRNPLWIPTTGEFDYGVMLFSNDNSFVD